MVTVSMIGHMVFFFQAEDGIRDLVRSRGLGDVYKRQPQSDEVQRNLARLEEFGDLRILAIVRSELRELPGLSLIHI